VEFSERFAREKSASKHDEGLNGSVVVGTRQGFKQGPWRRKYSQACLQGRL
jgi:hypothetical protein